MNMPRRTQAERRAETREALVVAARAAFAEKGFARAAREDICAAAGVSRGALDHHFEGKLGLFEAVFEQLEEEQAQRIVKAARKHTEPSAQLRAGARAYIEAASDPAIRQIIHVDARAALGYEAWHKVHSRYGVALLEGTIRSLGEGQPPGSTQPKPALLAELLLAALTAAALHVAYGSGSRKALKEAQVAADFALSAFTPQSAKRSFD